MSPSGGSAGRIITRAVVLVACHWNAGCQHGPAVPETGRSSFTVVEPRRPPPPEPSEKELVEPVSRANYREAQAIHPLVMPVYPPAALAAKAGAATVGVRVTVDANGAVADIRPSMLAIGFVPSKYADDFRAAVEVAVRQWKFAPARVHSIERVTEGEFTYDRVTRTELIEAEFDLAFTFTLSGRVEVQK
jgi:hypothetical protein